MPQPHPRRAPRRWRAALSRARARLDLRRLRLRDRSSPSLPASPTSPVLPPPAPPSPSSASARPASPSSLWPSGQCPPTLAPTTAPEVAAARPDAACRHEPSPRGRRRFPTKSSYFSVFTKSAFFKFDKHFSFPAPGPAKSDPSHCSLRFPHKFVHIRALGAAFVADVRFFLFEGSARNAMNLDQTQNKSLWASGAGLQHGVDGVARGGSREASPARRRPQVLTYTDAQMAKDMVR